jgi:hypothetical protein
MPKLQVRGEPQGLRHGLELKRKRLLSVDRHYPYDISPRLKHHHRNGFTREHVTNDELGDNVQRYLLVRDCLDDTDWNRVHKSDNQRKDQTPDRQLCGPHSDTYNPESKHHGKYDEVPPIGN